MTTGRAVRALAVVAAVLALAACGSVESVPLPAGVSAQLVQYRSDVATRQVVVEVTNGTDAPLEIGEVAVSDVRFVEPAVRVVDRPSTVAPGVTVAIRVQLPGVACYGGSDGGADAAPPPSARVHWQQGEVAGVSEIALADPLDVLDPLHERECRAQTLAEAAAVSFSGFTPSPPGAPAILTLSVVPTGRAHAEIESVRPTNLLMVGAELTPDPLAYPLGLAVGPASAPVSIDLPLLPFRCDAHAVQEDKRGTIFGFEIRADGASGQIEVAAPPEMRAAILTWVAQWCGFGT